MLGPLSLASTTCPVPPFSNPSLIPMNFKANVKILFLIGLIKNFYTKPLWTKELAGFYYSLKATRRGMIQRLVKLWQKQTELSRRHFFLCFFHTSHLAGEGCSAREIRVGADVMWLPSVALTASALTQPAHPSLVHPVGIYTLTWCYVRFWGYLLKTVTQGTYSLVKKIATTEEMLLKKAETVNVVDFCFCARSFKFKSLSFIAI